jgi:hypothetical protein
LAKYQVEGAKEKVMGKKRYQTQIKEKEMLKKIGEEELMDQKIKLEKYKIREKYRAERKKVREKIKPGSGSKFLFGGSGKSSDLGIFGSNTDASDYIFGRSSGGKKTSQSDIFGTGEVDDFLHGKSKKRR